MTSEVFLAGQKISNEDIDKAIEDGQLFDYTKGVCSVFSFFLFYSIKKFPFILTLPLESLTAYSCST